MSDERHTCQNPDRHEMGLLCGHPLPCPYHTAIIDLENEEIVIPTKAKAALNARYRLGDIAAALIVFPQATDKETT